MEAGLCEAGGVDGDQLTWQRLREPSVSPQRPLGSTQGAALFERCLLPGEEMLM